MGGPVDDEGEDLVNPYGNAARRRFTLGGQALRRRLIVLVSLLVSLALVVGTVGASCAPPPPREVPGAAAR